MRSIAPTSAGKTFISFYAMEQVLRSSDDEILVYVAPTKALVTQIAAEIYARFSKKMDGSKYPTRNHDLGETGMLTLSFRRDMLGHPYP